MKALPYFGGVPTKPDVDKLLEYFKVPSEGDFISYKDIGEVIDIEYQGPQHARFRTIVEAWRRHLEKHHEVFLEPDPGKGFVVADPNRRIDMGSGKFRTAIKTFVRVKQLSDIPNNRLPELSDEARKRYDYITVNSAKHIQSHRDSMKQMKREATSKLLEKDNH